MTQEWGVKREINSWFTKVQPERQGHLKVQNVIPLISLAFTQLLLCNFLHLLFP
jgi:hypothetical protein